MSEIMGSTWKHFSTVSALVSLVLAFGAADTRGDEPYWGPVNQSTCGSEPCEPLCVATVPRMPWYVQTEGLVLRRDVRGRRQIAAIGNDPVPAPADPDPAATIPVFSTSDLDQPFAGGGRVLVGHTFGESRFQVEASYFALAAFDSEAIIHDANINYLSQPGNMFTSFTNFGSPLGVDGVDYNDVISIRDHSTLHNAELNLVGFLPTIPGRLTSTVLIGVRYINVEEEFNYYSHSNVTALGVVGDATNRVATRTWNSIVGPQIGANAQVFIEDRWWVNLSLKGAICNNNALQRTTYTDTNSVDYFHEHGRNVTTYVGELDLSFLYRWSPNFTTRIGYQALWLEGIALAQENFDRDLAALTAAPELSWLDHNGRVVYHGVHAGIELAW